MTDPLKSRVVRHSPSTGEGSPDVWGIYEPDTGSIQYICADPTTRQAALIDVVWNFDPKNYRFSTESMDQVLDIVREHDLKVQWVLDRMPKTGACAAARVWQWQENDTTTPRRKPSKKKLDARLRRPLRLDLSPELGEARLLSVAHF